MPENLAFKADVVICFRFRDENEAVRNYSTAYPYIPKAKCFQVAINRFILLFYLITYEFSYFLLD